MGARPDQDLILDHLQRRPSVASVVAIGHHHVLGGAPLSVVLHGLQALEEMPCDWTVAILDQTATDSTRLPLIRRSALAVVRRLLLKAVAGGYRGTSEQQVVNMARRARRDLRASREADAREAGPTAGEAGPTRCAGAGAARTIDDLCGHLAQAVAEGFLGELAQV